MTIAILVLAAGGSTRMGPERDKLLEPVAGMPLLTLLLERAFATGAVVYVCLPSRAHPRARLFDRIAEPIWVADAAEGMGASIRTGISALPDGIDAAMILPADMPELTTEDLRKMLSAHTPGAIPRGCSADGQPGHPVIFPRECFEELQSLRGDQGARAVLAGHNDRITLVPLPDCHALVDLDTPEAWASWRSGHLAE